jgi:hypothetical protein
MGVGWRAWAQVLHHTVVWGAAVHACLGGVRGGGGG